MNFYYSGSLSRFGVQPDPFKSLGGLMSSTIVANGKIHSLFPEITSSSRTEKSVDVVGLFFKNNTTNNYLNFSYWLEYLNDSNSIYELAFVDVDQQNPTLEKIENIKSEPMFVNWTQSIDPEEPDLIQSQLSSGEIIGVWIKRTVNPIGENLSFSQMELQLKKVKDEVNICFVFDE